MEQKQKNAQKKSVNPFKSLWGSNSSSSKAKVRARPRPITKSKVDDPTQTVLKKYAGPAHLVAANLFYGDDRLWPKDEEAEKQLPWQASEGACIGILGAALGTYAAGIAAKLPTASIYEFDWRSDVARWRVKRAAAQAGAGAPDGDSKPGFYELNTHGLLPPPVQCASVLSVEPVLVQAGDALLRWTRMALEYGGTLVLQELCTDTGAPPSFEKQKSWMARGNASGQWLSLSEQKTLLRRNGFHIGKTRERTGAQLLSLRSCLTLAEERIETLNKAVKIAPSLQSVADHFNCERKAAKNRLIALEQGALAVYRMEVIKPRAGELI